MLYIDFVMEWMNEGGKNKCKIYLLNEASEFFTLKKFATYFHPNKNFRNRNFYGSKVSDI